MKKTILIITVIALINLISNRASAQFTKLFDFDPTTNGRLSDGSFISDGTFLYAMTSGGGANDMGVIFKILPDGSGYTKLLEFDGKSNGAQPCGSLLQEGDFLYGVTGSGGETNNGVIFKIKVDGTGYLKLHDFVNTSGGNPQGSLVSDGNLIYGMTAGGGTKFNGVIFSMTLDGSSYKDIFDFDRKAIGADPRGSLTLIGDYLYGMTEHGGSNDFGVLFKIQKDGSGYAQLLEFDGVNNGSNPDGDLISDGVFLYGSTDLGGKSNGGTIFKIKLDGTGYTKIYEFTASSGNQPTHVLVLSGKTIYGMANSGGGYSGGFGIIFQVNVDGTGFTKLFGFNDVPNGRNPRGSLLLVGKFLYGMTPEAGKSDAGIIFKYGI